MRESASSTTSSRWRCGLVRRASSTSRLSSAISALVGGRAISRAWKEGPRHGRQRRLLPCSTLSAAMQLPSMPRASSRCSPMRTRRVRPCHRAGSRCFHASSIRRTDFPTNRSPRPSPSDGSRRRRWTRAIAGMCRPPPRSCRTPFDPERPSGPYSLRRRSASPARAAPRTPCCRRYPMSSSTTRSPFAGTAGCLRLTCASKRSATRATSSSSGWRRSAA